MQNAQEEKRVITAYMVRNITALCTLSLRRLKIQRHVQNSVELAVLASLTNRGAGFWRDKSFVSALFFEYYW